MYRGDTIKLSAKTQYAIASMIYIANKNNALTTLTSISKDLNISKLYLEQTFSLLKKSNLVTSVKGSQGGYKLLSRPEDITILDILNATDNNLFDNNTIDFFKYPEINTVITNSISKFIDDILKKNLTEITLQQLVDDTIDYINNSSFIYYI